MNKNIVYGANEATNLTDKVNAATIAKDKEVKFGNGAFNAETIKNFATAASTQDGKIRFVYDAAGDSGMIFVGNQLVSSKILDIDANVVEKHEFDESTGEYKETTYQTSDTITVTWFDASVGEQKTTEFKVIDEKTVSNMIAAAVKKSSSDLTDKVNALEQKHTTDVSRLDTSVSGIETLLKSDVVSSDTGSALTVTPTAADATGYKTYKVAVNVDDTENAPIKVVDNKIKIATYKIAKVADASMEIDGGEKKYASEYQLMMTDADGNTKAVGDKINIAKDFLVTKAHVCTFKYVAENGAEIKYNQQLQDQWGNSPAVAYGDEVKNENQLPWSKNQDGTWEQARLGFGIKYGHSYLHLVINTKPTDTKAAKQNDVYLDFTEIFTTFKGDDEFITVENGVVSLMKDAVVTYVDTSLNITKKFNDLVAADSSIADRLTKLDTSVSAIEDSYVTDASLEAPKAGNAQFNTLKITNSKDGAESVVTVDIANQTYYEGLNTALNTLQENDKHLSALLTWEEL